MKYVMRPVVDGHTLASFIDEKHHFYPDLMDIFDLDYDGAYYCISWEDDVLEDLQEELTYAENDELINYLGKKKLILEVLKEEFPEFKKVMISV